MRHEDSTGLHRAPRHLALRVVGSAILAGALTFNGSGLAQRVATKKDRERAAPPGFVAKLRDQIRSHNVMVQAGLEKPFLVPSRLQELRNGYSRVRRQKYRDAVRQARAHRRGDAEAAGAAVGVRNDFHDGDSDTGPDEPQALNPLFDVLGLLGSEAAESEPVGLGHRMAFFDFDGDGDIDVFVGDKYLEYDGVEEESSYTNRIRYFENLDIDNGDGLGDPEFVERFGPDNPFDDFNQALGDTYGLGPYGTFAPFLLDYDAEVESGDETDELLEGPEAFVGTPEGTILYLDFNPGTGQFEPHAADNPLRRESSDSGPLPDEVQFTVPHFVDINGDDDLDAFVGTFQDGVLFFLNNGDGTFTNQTGCDNDEGACGVDDPFADFDWEDFRFTTPFFTDIDGDEDLDAFVGTTIKKKEIGGYSPYAAAALPGIILHFEEQDADEQFEEAFELGENPLQGNFFELPAPYLVDLDADGDLDAFVGGKFNVSSYMRNTGDATSPAFLSTMTGLEFVDFDGDGDLDAFAGAGYLGGVAFFENTGTPSEPRWEIRRGVDDPFDAYNGETDLFSSFLVRPAVGNVDGDDDLEAFVGTGKYDDSDFELCFFEQDGFDFVQEDTPIAGFPTNGDEPDCTVFDGPADPHLADFDGDGDLDLIVGTKEEIPQEAGGYIEEGRIYFFENQGTNSGNFVLVDTFGDDPDEEIVADNFYLVSPTLADVDGDGDLDLIVGGIKTEDGPEGPYSSPTVALFENVGDEENWSFDFEDPVPVEAFTTFSPTPVLADVNGDGGLDLFLGGKLAVDAFLTEEVIGIPTLGQWAQGALAGLLGLLGWAAVRRRI